MNRLDQIAWLLLLTLPTLGCMSPYHADRGALLGGLGGAGVGAIVGNQLGSTAAGAAVGGLAGALGGAAIGSGMDEMEARNRAMIEAQMGRQVAAGAASFDDVIAMTQAGVQEDLIINHLRIHGVARPPQAADLIMLQQQGVSPRVVRAMQEPPMQQQPAMVAVPAPAPVIVEEYHYGPPPYWGPHCHRPHGCYRGPGVSWGVTIRD